MRLVDQVPRERRVVIDCDGKYNESISVTGDYNDASAEESRRWIELCDSISDKIYQPTFHPLRSNVRTFFFHAYNPQWEIPLDFTDKEFRMYYVGHNCFRWRPMKRVIRALEPVLAQLVLVGMVRHGWGVAPPSPNSSIIVVAYY